MIIDESKLVDLISKIAGVTLTEFTQAQNLVVLVSPDPISRRRRSHLLYFNYGLRSKSDDSTLVEHHCRQICSSQNFFWSFN